MLKPTGSYILVTDPPAENRSKSGLILPDHYDRVKTGIVEEFRDVDLQVMELGVTRGDVVYYTEGCEISIKDKTLIHADSIIAIDKMED